MNETGQYEFQSDEQEYVENPSVSNGEKESANSEEMSDAEPSRGSKASSDAGKKENSEENIAVGG